MFSDTELAHKPTDPNFTFPLFHHLELSFVANLRLIWIFLHPLHTVPLLQMQVCLAFLIGNKHKSLNTSIGAALFAMIWQNHPCIWKTSFWSTMEFTLILTMITGSNVVNVSALITLNVYKKMYTPMPNMFVPLCLVISDCVHTCRSISVLVLLLIILFQFYFSYNGSMWQQPSKKEKEKPRLTVTISEMTRGPVTLGSMFEHLE